LDAVREAPLRIAFSRIRGAFLCTMEEDLRGITSSSANAQRQNRWFWTAVEYFEKVKSWPNSYPNTLILNKMPSSLVF
jgi:hypothetical protein